MTATRSVMLTDEERTAVMAPIERAATLPNRTFTSPEWFDLEVERIFSRTWVAYCYTAEVPASGSALPRDLASIPLVAVHGTDGQIRVFHNVCPYDGCPVVLEPQSDRTAIRAPYHGWRFELDGTLVAIPYWDGTAEGDLAALGGKDGNLRPVAAEVYMGIVFVNLSAEPTPFEEYIAPLARIMEPFDLDAMMPGAPSRVSDSRVYTYEVAGNWKTYYENTNLNVLHESFTHVLYDMSTQVPRAKDGKKTYWDHLDGGLMALAYHHRDFVETYPQLGFPHLGHEEEPAYAYFAAQFPNLHLGIAADTIVPMIALPLAPDRTLIHELYFMRDSAADDPALASARESLYWVWKMAHDEDARIVEGVQRARRSPAVDQKFYAPFWDVMHYTFNQQVLAAVEEGALP